MALLRNRQGALHVGVASGLRRLELHGGKPGAQIVGLALQCPPIGNLAFEHRLQRGQQGPQGPNEKVTVLGERAKTLTVLRRRVGRQQIDAAGHRDTAPAFTAGNLGIA